MASYLFNLAKNAMLGDGLKWNDPSFNIMVMLLAGSDAESLVSATSIAEVETLEVSGTGYSRVPLLGRTIGLSADATPAISAMASPPVWASLNVGRISGAAIYLDLEESSVPLVYVDFPDLTTNGGGISIEFPGGVVFKFN